MISGTDMLRFFYFFYFKFLLDRGPFYRTAGTLCFGLRMTLLPMGFIARMDSPLPTLFCSLHAMVPGAISGFRDLASLLPLRGEQYCCSSPARQCLALSIFNKHKYYSDLLIHVNILPKLKHRDKNRKNKNVNNSSTKLEMIKCIMRLVLKVVSGAKQVN